ncbi:PREDICTED: lateral signaling target protein 2 homolog [Dinoponera quadriceps]|uniref:Lateral signaling target protein 2 homolog n=1 Tax=Dinoponera quadriceps TaxID=609295 RepID=A0A6P3XAK8_DINQU|nr:PREDICTED: lateral signaling target protein 2 homolog [Dinoponera quadriceps]
MEDLTHRLTELSEHYQHRLRQHYHYHHFRHHRGTTPVCEFGDDECSTDSGCSSSGSISSGERLFCQSSDERPDRLVRSPRSHCYQKQLRTTYRSTRSQDRGVQRSLERTWSPKDMRSLPRDGVSRLSYSSSPSYAHSSSDSESLKRSSTTETLRRAFESLKIISSKRDAAKEKKHVKKSPKRILRSPIPYIYVRGLSGLPTQRVPRNGLQQRL